MKYLNLYESFWNRKKIDNEDIVEICYDLTDSGKFMVKIGKFGESPQRYHVLRGDYSRKGLKWICIAPIEYGNQVNDVEFKFEDIKDTVLRIVDYLGNRYKFSGYVLDAGFDLSPICIDLKKINEKTNIDDIRLFNIWYK